jgi:hypothetical protein
VVSPWAQVSSTVVLDSQRIALTAPDKPVSFLRYRSTLQTDRKCVRDSPPTWVVLGHRDPVGGRVAGAMLPRGPPSRSQVMFISRRS